ncbi:hypothetical protein R3P38DRAFT_3181404 [Favolaschia claudopus]|uniref:F-box domain-containing protein n=1 Tax=Favolaschia claudopus TaxID=2862362 RepID=A0AAW0CIQ4_9AGAR
MHRVLRIAEIVSLISQEIDFSSLPSFARVCKTFTDPALDVLWSEQEDLANILRCMPAGIWNESPEDSDSDSEDEDGTTWTLNRPVARSDWDRSLYYAHRVKFFQYNDGPSSPRYPNPCTPKFLDCLHLCFPDPCIFPNLQTLHWHFERGLTFAHIRLFLGPCLHTLSVAVLQSIAHLSFLPFLAAACPLLKVVGVECSDELDGRNSVSSLISGLCHLESVNLPYLNNSALEHIARLPRLRSLTLLDQRPLDPFPPTVFLNIILFTRLSKLNIHGDGVSSIVPLLTLMVHAPLVNIDVTIPTDSPAVAFAQCYSALAHHCLRSHSSLKVLNCSRPMTPSATPTNTTIANHVVTGSQFSPLLSFSNVTAVHLSAPVGFDLDDITVANLATAWPRLRQLCIFSDVFVNPPSRITLNGLLAIAQHCRHLVSLTLPIDASLAPRWPQPRDHKTGGKRIRQNSLRRWQVERSPISNPLLVASFLSSVFPGLTTIITDQEYKHNSYSPEARIELAEALAFHEKWKTAEAALPLLRKARNEERGWTKLACAEKQDA